MGNPLKKVTKGLKKVGKKIGSAFKKIGKKLKNGIKKVAGKFAELGPLGSIALSFVIPTVGAWFKGLPDGNFLKVIADGVSNVTGVVKDGVGKVFNRITDAVEAGLNGISTPFMQEGARGAGSALRDGISNLTGDFIEGSTKGLDVPDKKGLFGGADFAEAQASGKVDLAQAQASLDRKHMKLSKKDSFSNILKEDGQGNLMNKVENINIDDLSKREISQLKDVGTLDVKMMDDKEITSWTKHELDPKTYAPADKLKIDSRDHLKEVDQRWYHSGVDSTGWKAGAKAQKVTNFVDDLEGGPAFLKPDSYSVLEPSGSGTWREHIGGSKEFGVAKKLVPVQAATSAYFQQQEQAEAALQYAKSAQAEYFSNVAQNVLQRPVEPNVSYLNFNNMLDDDQMFLLQNSYSGILSGDKNYG